MKVNWRISFFSLFFLLIIGCSLTKDTQIAKISADKHEIYLQIIIYKMNNGVDWYTGSSQSKDGYHVPQTMVIRDSEGVSQLSKEQLKWLLDTLKINTVKDFYTYQNAKNSTTIKWIWMPSREQYHNEAHRKDVEMARSIHLSWCKYYRPATDEYCGGCEINSKTNSCMILNDKEYKGYKVVAIGFLAYLDKNSRPER